MTRRLRWVERVLWVVGTLSVALCVAVGLEGLGFRMQAVGIGQERTPPTPKTMELPPAVLTPDASGRPIGRIDVPALRLSAPIAGSVDAGDLRLGVGHIRGTALPGGLGTVGLAGHRDTFFRPLRRIQPGMQIDLTGAGGTYHYRVDSIEIVTPDKVHVLDIAARPAVTLITCFPFDYIGAAPRRFIVHGHLLSAAPDSVSPHP